MLVVICTACVVADVFILADSSYGRVYCFFFFKQKTAYELRISDWSSDVCSSDLARRYGGVALRRAAQRPAGAALATGHAGPVDRDAAVGLHHRLFGRGRIDAVGDRRRPHVRWAAPAEDRKSTRLNSSH